MMFDIVYTMLQELFDWLPMISVFVIVLGMIGAMVFKR